MTRTPTFCRYSATKNAGWSRCFSVLIPRTATERALAAMEWAWHTGREWYGGYVEMVSYHRPVHSANAACIQQTKRLCITSSSCMTMLLRQSEVTWLCFSGAPDAMRMTGLMPGLSIRNWGYRYRRRGTNGQTHEDLIITKFSRNVSTSHALICLVFIPWCLMNSDRRFKVTD